MESSSKLARHAGVGEQRLDVLGRDERPARRDAIVRAVLALQHRVVALAALDEQAAPAQQVGERRAVVLHALLGAELDEVAVLERLAAAEDLRDHAVLAVLAEGAQLERPEPVMGARRRGRRRRSGAPARRPPAASSATCAAPRRRRRPDGGRAGCGGGRPRWRARGVRVLRASARMGAPPPSRDFPACAAFHPTATPCPSSLPLPVRRARARTAARPARARRAARADRLRGHARLDRRVRRPPGAAATSASPRCTP